MSVSTSEQLDLAWSELSALDASGFMAALAEGKLPASFPRFEASYLDASDSTYMDRNLLADVLEKSNAALGQSLKPETLAAIRGDAVFLIAGQQPGLMLGPLYTYYKALTVVLMAKQISQQTGQKVIPAFWIAGEDHDIEEVNHFYLNGEAFACKHDELTAASPPVAAIDIEPWSDQLKDFIAKHGQGYAGAAKMLARFDELNLSNYTAQCAQILHACFPEDELVLLDPMQLRCLTSPVLASIVEQMPTMLEALAAGGQVVEEAGFARQLDSLTLFEIDEYQRKACRFEDGLFSYQGKRLTPSEMAAVIRQQAERFSPSAGMRPVCQDAVLPNLATIGGPSELRYLWQIDGIYQKANVKRSKLWPRISATLVDYRSQRTAEKLGIASSDLFKVIETKAAAEETLAEKHEGDEFEALYKCADGIVDQLKVHQDAGNERWLEKSLESIRYQVNKSISRLRAGQASDERVVIDRCERILNILMPGGVPQERRESLWAWFMLTDEQLLQLAYEQFDPMQLSHQLLLLDATYVRERVE